MAAMPTPYALALHGGIPAFPPGRPADEAPYRDAMLAALAAGEAIVAAGGSALDAVIATVVSLEDCPLFNAGRGSAFTAEGTHELDAGVSSRARRSAPSAPSNTWDRNRAVDDDASGPPSDGRRSGTVGAVARDRNGHLAAATSTGGPTNKVPSRIADTPIVGAGVYANDATCAVSCTGTGKHFMRSCAAHDIHARMRHLNHDIARAAADTIAQSLAPLGGRGGVIAVSHDGQFAFPFNSAGMFRGWVREGELPRAAAFA